LAPPSREWGPDKAVLTLARRTTCKNDNRPILVPFIFHHHKIEHRNESEAVVGHISYSNVFAVDHPLSDGDVIQMGDLVRTGPNLFPHFEVMAVVGDKAWVRDVQTGAEAITLTSRCARINGPHVASV
jgi:hypothetical protein